MRPLLPPPAIRDRLPAGEVWRWVAASLRQSVPRRVRVPASVERSGRFTDLSRALARARVAELDPRLAAARAALEAGEPLPDDPALLLVTALAHQRELPGPEADRLLREARGRLDVLAGDVQRPMPRASLLAPLHALALGGMVLDDPRARGWRREMLPRYWSAFAEATHEDGVPADRSPATLTTVLRDALLARTLWRAAGFVAPTDPMRRLRRMARALARLSRPGLGAHRFGPGPFTTGEDRDAVLALAGHILGEPVEEPDGPWALPSGGFYGFAIPELGVRLALTAGRVDPSRLPRGEHADLFSWELDVGGRPIVGDPGGADDDPVLRDFARRTRAHSTVCLEDEEQMPLLAGGWSGAPPEILDLRVEPEAGRFGFHGRARLPGGAEVIRSMEAGGEAVTVRDRVEGAAGRTVRTLVHFAPTVRLQGVGRVVEARAGATRLEVQPLGVTRLDVVMAERRRPSQGWWFGNDGRPEPAPVLVLEAERYDGRELGCILRWRD